MSLGTLTSQGSNQTIRMRSKPTISSDIVITKPPVPAEKCPLENKLKRFPVIGGSPQKEKSKKKSVSSSDSLEFWLKPGISLPKLHSKDVAQKRLEAGESFTCFSYSNLSKKQKESEFYEIPPVDSEKCLQIESESLEVLSSFAGPSPCQFLFKVPSSEINLDKFQAKEEAIEADNAFKNWKNWTHRHKKQESFLGKRLKKEPFNLLLRKTDLYRQALEDKIMTEASQIPLADKWRGHPSIWEAPIQAKKKKGKAAKSHERDSSPAYFLQRTPSQKGILPDLEFIRTSKLIKKEKHFKTSLDESNRKTGNTFATMKEKRIQKFLKPRGRIRPTSEDFDQLVVVGNKISQTPKEVRPNSSVTTNVPLIKVTYSCNETSCRNYRQSVFCLVINGVEIKYELPWKPQSKNEENVNCTWELDFGVNEPEKRIEKTLQIENKGTVAVRYKWISKLEQGQKWNVLVPKQHEPSFFFNKNSGIFLPGQIYNLKFYYLARKSGVQTETWYLKTVPSLGKNGKCGTIILSAVASASSLDLKSHILEAYLRERLRDSIVKFIVNILLVKVTSPDTSLYEVEYRSLFSEKELFEYHNPKYYYHSEMVVELSKLFEKIPSKTQNNWDLSLDSLKKLISTNTKGRDREYLLRDLCNSAKAILTPSRVFSRKEKKYRMAYNILCKMTNFMDADYEYLRNLLSNKKRETENPWEFCAEEETAISLTSEENYESDLGSAKSLYEIKPNNLMYLQIMFYIKVYGRVSEAVESIVGMLETSKKFESPRNIDYKLTRPSRTSREIDSFSCLQIFSK